MEVQLASTLKVLADSIDDKKVQAHGLKFLVECGNSRPISILILPLELNEDRIQDLPIIETVLLSIQKNNTVKTILKLGCSVLITYSRFRKYTSLQVICSMLCGSGFSLQCNRVHVFANCSIGK